MRCITNVALSIKGERVERGAEIELSAEDLARLDPADVTPFDAIPAPEPEDDLGEIALADMSLEQLKARAKELGLAASGSKADLQERIALHLESPAPEPEDDEITNA